MLQLLEPIANQRNDEDVDVGGVDNENAAPDAAADDKDDDDPRNKDFGSIEERLGGASDGNDDGDVSINNGDGGPIILLSYVVDYHSDGELFGG